MFVVDLKDTLPAIDGFVKLWGSSVFHCPYCHGWEVRDQPLAIYKGFSYPKKKLLDSNIKAAN
jgi:pyruvate-formate lyase-activating enzyme